jgi:hypothetical protein
MRYQREQPPRGRFGMSEAARGIYFILEILEGMASQFGTKPPVSAI